jgi:hypothetical protein
MTAIVQNAGLAMIASTYFLLSGMVDGRRMTPAGA